MQLAAGRSKSCASMWYAVREGHIEKLLQQSLHGIISHRILLRSEVIAVISPLIFAVKSLRYKN